VKAIRDADGNVIGRLDLFDFIEDQIQAGEIVLTLDVDAGVEEEGPDDAITFTLAPGYILTPMKVVNRG